MRRVPKLAVAAAITLLSYSTLQKKTHAFPSRQRGKCRRRRRCCHRCRQQQGASTAASAAAVTTAGRGGGSGIAGAADLDDAAADGPGRLLVVVRRCHGHAPPETFQGLFIQVVHAPVAKDIFPLCCGGGGTCRSEGPRRRRTVREPSRVGLAVDSGRRRLSGQRGLLRRRH